MKLKNLLLGGAVLVAGSALGTLLVFKNRKTIPDGVTAIDNFDLHRYLGKWYEIARFDFFYERDMDFVTADYSLNEDGSVQVVNRGFNTKKRKFQTSVGRAEFVGDSNQAKLQVSFFGPFYSGYNVIAIDPEYKYALVSGRNRDYLWFLSREREMPQDILENYLELAHSLGYDISKLVWTAQD